MPVEKACDKCGETYSGFGTTCGECRKGLKGGGEARKCEKCGQFFNGFGNTCNDCGSSVVGNKCALCGTTVYAMEKLQCEGFVFHINCFKCAQCGCKLSMESFAKSTDNTFYCKVHYEKRFMLRGRYTKMGLEAPPDTINEKVQHDEWFKQKKQKRDGEVGAVAPAVDTPAEAPKDDAPAAPAEAAETPVETPQADAPMGGDAPADPPAQEAAA